MADTCKFISTRGETKGNRCNLNPRQNSEFCHKHRNSNAAKGKHIDNDDKLKNDPIFNKKKEKVKNERTSVWSWTINSNTPYDKMNEEEKQRFKDFIDDTMEKDNIINYIEDKTSDNPSANIDKIKTDHYFEIGPMNGLLHAHGYTKITHHGFLRLKLNELRSDARAIFGKNIHFHFPVSSDHESLWQSYITKHNSASHV